MAKKKQISNKLLYDFVKLTLNRSPVPGESLYTVAAEGLNKIGVRKNSPLLKPLAITDKKFVINKVETIFQYLRENPRFGQGISVSGNPVGLTNTQPSCKDYHVDVTNDKFLLSYEWRQLRMVALKAQGARCQCCGASPKDGIVLHVDHIKPRRKYPELALVLENLQVLCEACNHGKGNWDETDWRG